MRGILSLVAGVPGLWIVLLTYTYSTSFDLAQRFLSSDQYH